MSISLQADKLALLAIILLLADVSPTYSSVSPRREQYFTSATSIWWVHRII